MLMNSNKEKKLAKLLFVGDVSCLAYVQINRPNKNVFQYRSKHKVYESK